jgi:alpha-tubulin suppressor-like RCC1 family protein
VCWGSNSVGQSTAPAGTFTQISGGADHTCALRASGTVTCWGKSNWAQVTPKSGTFTQVASGFNHTRGLHEDGSVTCWGDSVLPPF